MKAIRFSGDTMIGNDSIGTDDLKISHYRLIAYHYSVTVVLLQKKKKNSITFMSTEVVKK